LFGVTTLTPRRRKIGYEVASAGSLVLSTRIERPGAEARYPAISSWVRAPDLVREGASTAVFHSAAGMAGE
jgi:hypothetical protein